MSRINNGIEKSLDNLKTDGPPLPQQRDSEILLTMRESVNTERKILDQESNQKSDVGEQETHSKDNQNQSQNGDLNSNEQLNDKNSLVKNILCKIDIYGKPLQIQYQNKFYHHQRHGIILSIISILFVALLILGQSACIFEQIQAEEAYLNQVIGQQGAKSSVHNRARMLQARTNTTTTTTNQTVSRNTTTNATRTNLTSNTSNSTNVTGTNVSQQLTLQQLENELKILQNQLNASNSTNATRSNSSTNTTNSSTSPVNSTANSTSNASSSASNIPQSPNIKIKSDRFNYLNQSFYKTSKKGLSAIYYGIESINVVLNFAAMRDQDTNDLVISDKTNAQISWQNQLRNSSLGQYRKSKKDLLTLMFKFLRFQIDVENLRGNNSNSSFQTTIIPFSKFNLSDPLFPSLDITKYVQVLGDFISQNSSEFRTITTFRLAIDYESIQVSALNDTLAYFNNFTQNESLSDLYQNATIYICNDYVSSLSNFAGFTDEQKQNQINQDQQTIAQLSQAYFATSGNLDENFWKGYVDYIAKITAQLQQNEETGPYGVEAALNGNTGIGANQLIDQIYIDQFLSNQLNCLDVYKTNGKIYLKGQKFIDKYNQNLKKKIGSMAQYISSNSSDIGDSIQIFVKNTEKQQPDLILQDATFSDNFQCFKNALNNIAVNTTFDNYLTSNCNREESLVYFRLHETVQQFINITAPNPLNINPPNNTNNSMLEVSRVLSLSRNPLLGYLPFQFTPPTDFQTLWSVTFALEDEVLQHQMITLVQDPSVDRRLLQDVQDQDEQVQDSNNHQKSYYIKRDNYLLCLNVILDLCAFLGAVWFLISKVGISISQFQSEKDLYFVDIQSKMFHQGSLKNQNRQIDDEKEINAKNFLQITCQQSSGKQSDAF